MKINMNSTSIFSALGELLICAIQFFLKSTTQMSTSLLTYLLCIQNASRIQINMIDSPLFQFKRDNQILVMFISILKRTKLIIQASLNNLTFDKEKTAHARL